jgi:Helix-turn-helix domain
MTDLVRLRAVDEKAAAELLGYSIKTLQNWRLLRKGPAYLKTTNGRSIRYRIGDLLDFQAAGRVNPESLR